MYHRWKNIPVDIMKSAVYRATASVSLEFWEANKVRSIACALVCGYYARKGESITMGLDKIAAIEVMYLAGYWLVRNRWKDMDSVFLVQMRT